MTDRVSIEPIVGEVARIGRESAAPAGQVGIALAGATITADPTTPAGPPGCVVTAPEEAAAAIGEVYGEAVARAVRQAVDSGAGREAELEGRQAIATLTRLTGVRWCREHSPLPLNGTLLALEDAVLTGQFAGFLDPEEDEWLDTLQGLGDQLLDYTRHGGPPLPGLGETVEAALELLATTVPVGDPLQEQAAARLRDWAPGADLVEAGRREAEPGPRPGQLLGDLFTGTSTVDWADVPRGLISRNERNLHWAIEADDDEATLEVAADGWPAPAPYPGLDLPAVNPPDRLAFDVHLPGRPFPVVSGWLRRNPVTGAWTGRHEPSRAQSRLLSEAIDSGQPLGVRVRSGVFCRPADPVAAEAYRWSCRGLSGLRLASQPWFEVPIDGAIGSLRRAMMLWRACHDEEAASSCATLAESGQIHSHGGEDDKSAAPGLTTSLAELWWLLASAPG